MVSGTTINEDWTHWSRFPGQLELMSGYKLLKSVKNKKGVLFLAQLAPPTVSYARPFVVELKIIHLIEIPNSQAKSNAHALPSSLTR
jgi:hypothetical protein